MKMESFSKHPYGVVSSNSNSAPSSGGSFYDSAHFSANTIFVEFEDDSREMGVRLKKFSRTQMSIIYILLWILLSKEDSAIMDSCWSISLA